jgi:hypothetical protein
MPLPDFHGVIAWCLFPFGLCSPPGRQMILLANGYRVYCSPDTVLIGCGSPDNKLHRCLQRATKQRLLKEASLATKPNELGAVM